jgi:hypothetical protein
LIRVKKKTLCLLAPKWPKLEGYKNGVAVSAKMILIEVRKKTNH